MDIIKESPLCFTDGEELKKEGDIFWDPSNSLYVYWDSACARQCIPEAIALNPEDVVDLRATCTVDEVLRMRAAGVL